MRYARHSPAPQQQRGHVPSVPLSRGVFAAELHKELSRMGAAEAAAAEKGDAPTVRGSKPVHPGIKPLRRGTEPLPSIPPFWDAFRIRFLAPRRAVKPGELPAPLPTWWQNPGGGSARRSCQAPSCLRHGSAPCQPGTGGSTARGALHLPRPCLRTMPLTTRLRPQGLRDKPGLAERTPRSTC